MPDPTPGEAAGDEPDLVASLAWLLPLLREAAATIAAEYGALSSDALLTFALIERFAEIIRTEAPADCAEYEQADAASAGIHGVFFAADEAEGSTDA